MTCVIPFDLVIKNSSIPNHTDINGVEYPQWTNQAYLKNTIVSHLGCLYSAETNIYPMATYSHNDIANTITPEVIRLSDNAIITPTAVPCVKDQTVVYVIDTWKEGREDVVGKYFIYVGTTGNIDFTVIDPKNPSTFHFNPINNYTELKVEPVFGDSSLYWKYLGRTNRNKIIDKAYNSQSIIQNSTEAWWEFEVEAPDVITLFNVATQKAKITIYTTDINNPIYENTMDDLLDTSSIINWRTLVRYRNKYKNTTTWTIPFISGTYTVRITLMSTTPMDLKLGEAILGLKQDVGITVDGVPTQIKSSGKIIENDNGEVVFQDEGDITKVYLIYTFGIKYDSITHDAIIDKCTELINRRIVVNGENTDKQEYRSLTVFGHIMDASPTLKTNNTKSDIQIQVRRIL